MSNWQAYKRLQEAMLRKSAADTRAAMDKHRADTQEAMRLSVISGEYNQTGVDLDQQADAINQPSTPVRPPPPNNSRYRYTGMPPSPMSASVDGSRLLENISAGGGGDGGGGGGGGFMPQREPRERRPSAPMQSRLMGSAGGGGLNQFYQNQRTPNQFQQLQRRGYAAAPTPRQRFTA